MRRRLRSERPSSNRLLLPSPGPGHALHRENASSPCSRSSLGHVRRGPGVDRVGSTHQRLPSSASARHRRAQLRSPRQLRPAAEKSARAASPRSAKAWKASLTTSTFSCEIAYSRSPAASALGRGPERRAPARLPVADPHDGEGGPFTRHAAGLAEPRDVSSQSQRSPASVNSGVQLGPAVPRRSADPLTECPGGRAPRAGLSGISNGSIISQRLVERCDYHLNVSAVRRRRASSARPRPAPVEIARPVSDACRVASSMALRAPREARVAGRTQAENSYRCFG